MRNSGLTGQRTMRKKECEYLTHMKNRMLIVNLYNPMKGNIDERRFEIKD